MTGSNTPSVERCVSSGLPGFLIKIAIGGIQSRQLQWLTLRDCSRSQNRELRWYSDSQIAQGLTYLVSTRATGDNGWFYSTDVAIEDRVRCVEAVASLFAQLFVPRSTPHLSHLSETEAGSLNGVCYMWWDGFPCLALASDPNLPRMQETALRTMARILGFKSIACQESALHGLGHWQRGHDRQVSAIIDGFLEANPDLDTRLVSYANAARCGCVL